MQGRIVIALTVVFRVCTGQLLPWGPETQWTRRSWSQLQLPFPYKLYRDFSLDPLYALHSNSGPWNIAHYDSHGARQRAGKERDQLLQCSVCHNLTASAWQSALSLIHQSGQVPSQTATEGILASLCTHETAEALLVGDGGIPPSLVEQLSPDESRRKCLQMVKDTDGHEGNSPLLLAIQYGIWHYTAHINHKTNSDQGIGTPDELEDQQSCKDFHSECSKWAARGECQNNPLYMMGLLGSKDNKYKLGHCRFSCGSCVVKSKTGAWPNSLTNMHLSSKLLKNVQQQGCNATGLCSGVDPADLPLTSPRLATRDSDSEKSLPLAVQQSSSEKSIHDLSIRVDRLPKEDCYYKNQGWWTYELCIEQHIKQFHVDTEISVPNISDQITIGLYDDAKQPKQSGDQVMDASQLFPGQQTSTIRYLKQKYTGGTNCITTALQGIETPRMAELRLACSPDADSHLVVEEPQQCQYLFLLFTPLLCSLSKTLEMSDQQPTDPPS